MSNESTKIAELARAILQKMDTGKEYTTSYVSSRLEAALEKFPHDSVIRSMAQVITKQVKNGKLTTSQKELYDVYNHYCRLNPNSMIKDAIGDLLYPVELPQSAKSNETNVSYRSNEPELSLKIENNPLENIFDTSTKTSSYYDPSMATLAKASVLAELKNIGVVPTNVKVFGGNQQGIMCDAEFKNKLGTVHVAIPVDISNGISAPNTFFNKDHFIELTAENLNEYIIKNAVSDEDIEARNTTIVEPLAFTRCQKEGKAIEFDKVELPETLKNLASFEQALLDTSTGFSPDVVRTAKKICDTEIKKMGFFAQVSLAEATDNCLICSAELNSSLGKTAIKLPVEIVDNIPQIPSVFYNDGASDKLYDFTKDELTKFLTAEKVNNNSIMRYSSDFFHMTYNQLKEEIMNAVVNGNYMRAEAALNRIEDKFGSDYHKAALSDYAKYLTFNNKPVESKHKCKLLITKGSLEPRCGHYNVVVSKVMTDENGNCTLIERKAKYDNLAESTGALIRTNKIILT